MVKASQGSPFYSQPFGDQSWEAQEARRRAALRDEFACQMLPFCAAHAFQHATVGDQLHLNYNTPFAAALAYAYADAMLQAREAK